jgi:hypothetical protein
MAWLFIFRAVKRATNDCSLTFTFITASRSYKKEALYLQTEWCNTNFFYNMAKPVTPPRGLKQLETLAKLMDAQFRIPGTDFRFGLDGLIGLIPGAGDLSTFAVSGYMVLLLARNGASGYVLARMILNILIDAVIGSIPLIGDLFDIAFKANMRNMKLMQEHYREGRHRGSAAKVIVPVLIVVFLIIAGIIWGTYELLTRLF